MSNDEGLVANSSVEMDQDSDSNIKVENNTNSESNTDAAGSTNHPKSNIESETTPNNNENTNTPFNPNLISGVNSSASAGPTQPPLSINKNNILEAIEEFDSSIPDAVVHHYLNIAGMQTSDQRIIRLIAIAAQKFIHDIVSDSLQHCKLRGAQGKKTKEKKYTLGIEDLSSALSEYGIEVSRQHYFN